MAIATPVIDNENKSTTKEPPMYSVIILNDDYTPFEFVVHILMDVFSMSRAKAISTMLKAHNTGVANCGAFTKDIAETKSNQVNEISSSYGYPLKSDIQLEE